MEDNPLLHTRWAQRIVHWMVKKDLLGQDIYLLGTYNALRRWLAFRFCTVMKREFEYVALTADTSESDLKQRREIVSGGTVQWKDQPAVRAALDGKVLILEGLEKVERNVLPVLNNLLENREMALEDGRFLVAPKRFDDLIAESAHGKYANTKDDAASTAKAASELGRRLVRVHPAFRVIAIGVPSPPFPGAPLDPPLRSRFQARHVLRAPPSAMLEAMHVQCHRRIQEHARLLQQVHHARNDAAVPVGSAINDRKMVMEQLLAIHEGLWQIYASHTVAAGVDSRAAAYADLAGAAAPPSESATLSAARLLACDPTVSLADALARLMPMHANTIFGEGDTVTGNPSVQTAPTPVVTLLHTLLTTSSSIDDGVDCASVGTVSKLPVAQVVSVERVGSVVERDSTGNWRDIVSTVSDGDAANDTLVCDEDEERALAPPLHRAAAGTPSNVSACDMGTIESALLITLTRGVATEESVPQLDSNAVQLVCSGGGGAADLTLFQALPRPHKVLLSRMLQSHASGADICLLGGRGDGKTHAVRALAGALGYRHVETLFLFNDMSARELLQRRSTDAKGNTLWADTPLVTAARMGRLCVLDGVDRLPAGLLAPLLRLLLERELALFDGRRLVSAACHAKMCSDLRLSAAQLRARGIERIHPSFRVVALATPPAGMAESSSSVPWLTAELLQLFHFFSLPAPSVSVFKQLIAAEVPGCRPLFVRLLAQAKAALQQSATSASTSSDMSDTDAVVYTDDSSEHGAKIPRSAAPVHCRLSLRHMLRIARRFTSAATDSTGAISPVHFAHAVEDALMVPFMPTAERTAVRAVLTRAGLLNVANAMHASAADECTEGSNDRAVAAEIVPAELGSGVNGPTEGELKIGNEKVVVRIPPNPELIPRVLFFDVPLHTRVLQQMLRDLSLGEHLLLMGNQGVGKNKLTDRLLELMWREREYVQLHRDTTVASLTLTPSMRGGIIVWEDSPLVRAMVHGRVLVVDEFDKAPAEVVIVLKSLLEDGEIVLADGRKFVSERSPLWQQSNHASLPTIERRRTLHINTAFRIIALANRPGYPFLGNDFFREMGDVFACHIVDNPDTESEMQMLQSYAPRVPRRLLRMLVAAFRDLRQLVDQGRLSYPYSARELVNIVRHLDRFPRDAVADVLEDVFAFDSFDPQLRIMLRGVFERHGIPFGVDIHEHDDKSVVKNVDTGRVTADEGHGFMAAEELPAPRLLLSFIPQTASGQIDTQLASAHCMQVSLASSTDGDSRWISLAWRSSRAFSFQEEVLWWQIGRVLPEGVLVDGDPLRGAWIGDLLDVAAAQGCVCVLTSQMQLHASDLSDPHEARARTLALFDGGKVHRNARRATYTAGKILLPLPATRKVGGAECLSVLDVKHAEVLVVWPRDGRIRRTKLSLWFSDSRAQSSLVMCAGALDGHCAPAYFAIGGREIIVAGVDCAPDSKHCDVARLRLPLSEGDGLAQIQFLEPGVALIRTLEGRAYRMEPTVKDLATVASLSFEGASSVAFVRWISSVQYSLLDMALRVEDGLEALPIGTALQTLPSPVLLSSAQPVVSPSPLLANQLRHTGPAESQMQFAFATMIMGAMAFSTPSNVRSKHCLQLYGRARNTVDTPKAAAHLDEDSRKHWQIIVAAAEGESKPHVFYTWLQRAQLGILCFSAPGSGYALLEVTQVDGSVRRIAVPARAPGHTHAVAHGPKATISDDVSRSDARSVLAARLQHAFAELQRHKAGRARNDGTSPAVAALERVAGCCETSDGQLALLWHSGVIRILELDMDKLGLDHTLWNSMAGQRDSAGTMADSAELEAALGQEVGRGEIEDSEYDRSDLSEDDTEEPKAEAEARGSGVSEAASRLRRRMQRRKRSGRGRGRDEGSGTGHGRGRGKSNSQVPARLTEKEQHDERAAQRRIELAVQRAKIAAAAAATEALNSAQNAVAPLDAVGEREYAELFAIVENEVAQLRSVLLSVEARERERVWLKGQVVGELDDARLVDGVLGEKNVFKRRGQSPNPPPSQRQKLPKRLIFVVDVSSSMANFNADERLDRLCATTLMVMEAFTGLGHKYEYAIVGHSGETAWLPLVAMGSPPSGRAARLGVIRAMIQHSSTCRSGDHTLDAGRRAVLELASEPADDRFVFLVSDANLEGYGVSPRRLAHAIGNTAAVEAHAIFIAEEETAKEIAEAMPPGRAHVVLDTTAMPLLFKNIFSEALLNDRNAVQEQSGTREKDSPRPRPLSRM